MPRPRLSLSVHAALVCVLGVLAVPACWAQGTALPQGELRLPPAGLRAQKEVRPELHTAPRTAVYKGGPVPAPVVNAHGRNVTPIHPSNQAAARSPAVVAPIMETPQQGSDTGLPLPRFASLRADEVNLRAGPGGRYPIEWVYKRAGMPVEILREFNVWRLVLTPDGAKGWMHEATLTGRRGLLVLPPQRVLRAAPKATARAVAILDPGVVGRIRSCAADASWCRVRVHGYDGWLPRDAFWGTLPDEAVKP